jgi:hypothetical protein
MSKRNRGGQPQGEGGSLTVTSNGSAEGVAPEGTAAEAQAPNDPFADCPVTHIGDDVEFSDFSGMPTRGSTPTSTKPPSAIVCPR